MFMIFQKIMKKDEFAGEGYIGILNVRIQDVTVSRSESNSAYTLIKQLGYSRVD